MIIAERRPARAEKPLPIVVIEPLRGWLRIDFASLWDHRELLYFLVWRELKVRYKQTALGALWALLQPLLTMVVFTLIFGRLAKMPSDNIPYPVFAFSALVPWTFFANGLSQSSASLVNSSNLITKVYFPRLAIPIASVISGLGDFGIAFIFLLLMMGFYRVPLSWRIAYVPLFLALAVVTTLAIGMWLSAMNVKYRDVRHTVPFLTQFWMFATPIVYPVSLIKGPWRTVYGLNPMVGVVEGFRWSLLGGTTQPGPELIVSVAAALVLFVSGAYYFRKMESSFADLV